MEIILPGGKMSPGGKILNKRGGSCERREMTINLAGIAVPTLFFLLSEKDGLTRQWTGD